MPRRARTVSKRIRELIREGYPDGHGQAGAIAYRELRAGKIRRNPPPPYAWIITRDHLWDEAREKGETPEEWERNEAGVIGPRGITAEQVAQLKKGKGVAFRMYDDDGILYYSGRYLGEMDEDAFGPLQDFGTPNAGATSIKYRAASGKWEEL